MTKETSRERKIEEVEMRQMGPDATRDEKTR